MEDILRSLYISEQLDTDLSNRAMDEGVSKSELIRRYLAEGVSSSPSKKSRSSCGHSTRGRRLNGYLVITNADAQVCSVCNILVGRPCYPEPSNDTAEVNREVLAAQLASDLQDEYWGLLVGAARGWLMWQKEDLGYSDETACDLSRDPYWDIGWMAREIYSTGD